MIPPTGWLSELSTMLGWWLVALAVGFQITGIFRRLFTDDEHGIFLLLGLFVMVAGIFHVSVYSPLFWFAAALIFVNQSTGDA